MMKSNVGDIAQCIPGMARGTLDGGRSALTTESFAQCWTLDSTGNWKGFREDDTGNGTWGLVQARGANPVNEITNITNTTGPAWAQPAYNPAGNMTTIPQPNDPAQYYTATYDAWNRLVKLVDTTTTDPVSEYAYDGAKRRIVQNNFTSGVLSETRHCYYTEPSRWQVLEERLGSSPDSADADRQFTWGQRYIDDLILRDRDTNSNGTLDERLYALQDANWNVIALANSTGAIQERFAYSAYGVPLFLNASYIPQSSSASDWETLYDGYRYHPLGGLFYIRNRVLNALVGTWLTRDVNKSILEILHLYQFCRSDPLSQVDPLGLISIGGGSIIPGGPNLPGGPWEPKIRIRCNDQDTCAQLFEKIRATIHKIDSHQKWDAQNPDPRWPKGRHADEIADALNGLRRCYEKYSSKCRKPKPPCRPLPRPVPVPVPRPPSVLPFAIVVIVVGVLILTPIPGDEVLVGGALLAI